MTENQSPRALGRLLGLFDALALEPEGVTLARLSIILATPKSSLLTMLRPLVAQEYLLHSNNRYQLGPELYRLAANILSTRKFSNLMRGFMESLANDCQETVILGVADLDTLSILYQDVIESPQSVRYVVPAGVSRKLYGSAGGRLVLAYQDTAWREKYIRSTKLEPLTDRTVTDPDRLLQMLEEIRASGYAFGVGEAVRGAAGVAAPIFHADGRLAAALLIGAPEDRAVERRSTLIDLVVRTAAEASRAMGYRE